MLLGHVVPGSDWPHTVTTESLQTRSYQDVDNDSAGASWASDP